MKMSDLDAKNRVTVNIFRFTLALLRTCKLLNFQMFGLSPFVGQNDQPRLKCGPSKGSYLMGMNMAMKQATGLATDAIVAARW